MDIKEAYCVELGRVVNIYEAKNAFHRLGGRDRFTFYCSTSACRENEVVVTGVNYAKQASEEEFYRAPHFRGVHPERHDPSCQWAEQAEAKAEVEAELQEEAEHSAADTGTGRHQTPKQSDVVDVFFPKGGVHQDDEAAFREVAALSTRGQRIATYKRLYRENLNGSSYLQEVVTCYRDLPYAERQELSLRIGRQRASYEQTFCTIKRYGSNDLVHIYHGGAYLEKGYGKGGALYRFMDQIHHGGKPRSVYLYISPEQIAAYPHADTLKATLEALKNGASDYVRAYFFGPLVPRPIHPERQDSVVQLDHLDNLVLIPISKGAN